MKTQGRALYPFIPSGPDFDRAIAFFGELGFETLWREGDLAGMRFGAAYFMLQKIDVPEWQKNQMIVVEVDDLEQYGREIAALDLPARYDGVQMKPPADYPWGREIHLIDPAGVCWHFREGKQSW